MGDLISRQAAIEALCKRCDLVQDENEPCMEKCNDIKILEKLPSEPQWIPCSERLPEEGKDTLVFISHKDKNSEVDIGMYEVSCGERGWSDAYGFWWDFEEIIAWMPLPEPYRKTEPQMEGMDGR